MSSLSENAGGTVKKKKGKADKAKGGQGSAEVEIVFEKDSSKRKSRPGGSSAAGSEASGAAAGSASQLPSAKSSAPKSAGWIGKTPVVFLKEYCIKNDRKRPMYVYKFSPH